MPSEEISKTTAVHDVMIVFNILLQSKKKKI